MIWIYTVADMTYYWKMTHYKPRSKWSAQLMFKRYTMSIFAFP